MLDLLWFVLLLLFLVVSWVVVMEEIFLLFFMVSMVFWIWFLMFLVVGSWGIGLWRIMGVCLLILSYSLMDRIWLRWCIRVVGRGILLCGLFIVVIIILVRLMLGFWCCLCWGIFGSFFFSFFEWLGGKWRIVGRWIR